MLNHVIVKSMEYVWNAVCSDQIQCMLYVMLNCAGKLALLLLHWAVAVLQEMNLCENYRVAWGHTFIIITNCPHKCLHLSPTSPTSTYPNSRHQLVITGMAATSLLRMHDRGICHHFLGNPCNGHPHCCGITACFTSVTVNFPWFNGITIVPIMASLCFITSTLSETCF